MASFKDDKRKAEQMLMMNSDDDQYSQDDEKSTYEREDKRFKSDQSPVRGKLDDPEDYSQFTSSAQRDVS